MTQELHATCTGCGEKPGILHEPLKGHFCPDCLKELVLVKDAENHLARLLEDTIAAWWTTWADVGLGQLERKECIERFAATYVAALDETA